jgi:hypothetical protein
MMNLTVAVITCKALMLIIIILFFKDVGSAYHAISSALKHEARFVYYKVLGFVLEKKVVGLLLFRI